MTSILWIGVPLNGLLKAIWNSSPEGGGATMRGIGSLCFGGCRVEEDEGFKFVDVYGSLLL